jgi:cell division protein FtsQ
VQEILIASFRSWRIYLNNKLKKINYKRILLTLIWIVVISGLGMSLAFVSKEQKQIRATKLSVSIVNPDEHQFIDESGVKAYFSERGDKIVETALQNIDLHKLEKALNAHPAIENSEVNYNMRGEVSVKVTQRVPIVRVITASGEGYYIDRQNRLMPLNDNYSARVLIASGFINDSYATCYSFSVDQIKANETFRNVSMLDNILDVATKINADTLLSNLIHQIYINKEKEIELFPAVGQHRIVLGSTELLDEKLNKLKLFYSRGLNKTNSWNKYSTLNLKYKNLVVCTKK